MQTQECAWQFHRKFHILRMRTSSDYHKKTIQCFFFFHLTTGVGFFGNFNSTEKGLTDLRLPKTQTHTNNSVTFFGDSVFCSYKCENIAKNQHTNEPKGKIQLKSEWQLGEEATILTLRVVMGQRHLGAMSLTLTRNTRNTIPNLRSCSQVYRADRCPHLAAAPPTECPPEPAPGAHTPLQYEATQKGSTLALHTV